MAKIKSKSELNDTIDEDLATRKYEISFLINLLEDKKTHRMAKVLAKALVIIAYAHWEGFVKLSSARYLSYVNFLSIPKCDMNSHLHAVGITWFGDVCGLSKSNVVHEIHNILCNDSYKLSFPIDPLVSTESNLNSEVLKKILADIGSDTKEFDNDFAFIDKKLLKYRNKYAHGEAQYADIEEALMIGNNVIILLNKYRDMLQNMIATEQYRRIPVSPLS